MAKKSEKVADAQVDEQSITEEICEDGVLEALLEKIRQVGKEFQYCKNRDVLDYTRLAQSLSEHLNSNVYVLDKKGVVLGY
ncbi:MAG: GTP-sensing pleiotropic transcriptional regulator CodY, partial [Synergistaceae bacterium]|nr:GTP-sensing pleiotropic transcriptional regulator CodY [Synergistaceae bacterium]